MGKFLKSCYNTEGEFDKKYTTLFNILEILYKTVDYSIHEVLASTKPPYLLLNRILLKSARLVEKSFSIVKNACKAATANLPFSNFVSINSRVNLLFLLYSPC